MATSQASSQTTRYSTGRSSGCPGGNCPIGNGVQFHPVAVATPVSITVPVPVPPKEQSINWDFGIAPKPTVAACVAAAIARNSVHTETQVPEKATKVNATGSQVSVRTENLHSHQCAKCGTVFSHSETNHGNAQAHMCPNCGYGPNYRRLN